MSKRRDLIGQKFGHLTVVRSAGNNKHSHAVWLCKCECGGQRIVSGNCLTRKIRPTKSCGCLIKNFSNTIHGMVYSITYISWHAMKNRCLNPKQPCSKGYADRGITIFEPWLTFSNFVADMGERPSRAHTLERIDGNGNYEPGNVRWATKKEQGRNRKTNVFIEINGTKRCISEWAEIHGIHKGTISKRLSLGWATDKLFSKPKTLTVKEPHAS